MLSSRPYLLRALHEWIIDSGLTPQVLIDAARDDVTVPPAAQRDGKVVLNISPSAVRDLEIDNEFLSCLARFQGVSHGVVVPVDAVLAVYARENGQGMMFPDDEFADGETGSDGAVPQSGEKPAEPPRDDSGEVKPPRRKPNLKVIK